MECLSVEAYHIHFWLCVYTTKGWEDAIRAVGLLKPKYPDVFFTCLFCETSPDNTEHKVYYEKLMKIVDELSLHDNVADLAWI